MTRLLFAISLLLGAAGCGTFDADNRPVQPWDSPTKSDQSQGWWVRDWEQTQSLSDPP